MTKRKSLSLKIKYKQFNQSFKPTGLWYSIDDGWAEWCYSSMPKWIKKYSHYLEMDLSKVLILESPTDLQVFEDVYSFIDQSGYRCPDWKKVSENYSGIEIRNFHQLRLTRDANYLSRLWFYGWDISGGCIWDLSCVKSLKVEITPSLGQINLQETD